MKQITNRLITVSLVFFAILVCVVSCDDMNEIQSQYADKDERVYLGKVDSIKSIAGFGRAMITWYVTADPKIEQTIIYWNQREDSIVRNISRTVSGVQKDSIIIENLPEGSTLFEFRNVNSRGQSSLFTSAVVTVWGENFAEGLRARRLTSTVFDYASSEFSLGFTPAAVGDSVVYSQIVYTDSEGTEKTLRIDRETNDTVLTGFSDGAEFRFRNVFFLPEGMDTVYGNYQTVKAPTAVFDNGKKITFPGNPNSRYSQHTATSLYEWTQAGDLILHELNDEGTFVQIESYPGLVPRDTYREFFFYDDDKFIGVGVNHQLFMFKIELDQLVFVKASSGAADNFGTGFSMANFLPGRGFFYAIQATGAMNAWYANNNASFANPNNISVDTDFLYNPFTMYNYSYIVAVDEDGNLWSIPVSTTGAFRGLNKIGSGWDRFEKLIAVGPKLLAVDSNGDFYEFDFNATDYFWVLD